MKKAIVVGATSGIGKELAGLLAGNGYIVGITGRRENLLAELAAGQPNQYFSKSFDITETTTVAKHLEELIEKMGGLNLLIISAGNGEENESLDFIVEKQMIDLNVSGFTCVADCAFNYFRKQGFGHLAAITSIAGLRGSRQAPAYSATKSFQVRYLEGLRQKAHKVNKAITITDIRPGFVNTSAAKFPIRFWVASTEKAARQIFRAIQKKRKVVYITRRWRILAWILKILPGWFYERL